MEAPVAVAEHLASTGVRLPVGSFVTVCDVGAGVEVTVLCRTAASFEVLATLAGPCGGRRHSTLAAALTNGQDMAADGAAPWVTTESARVAKESLLSYPAVTVPLADQPPVIANRAMLDEAVRPVVRRVADLTQQTIAAAELSARDLAGVYCVGGSARLPRLGEAIAEQTGITPAVVAEPQFVAAFGAAEAGSASHGVGVAVDVPVPPVRRAIGIERLGADHGRTPPHRTTHDARR